MAYIIDRPNRVADPDRPTTIIVRQGPSIGSIIAAIVIVLALLFGLYAYERQHRKDVTIQNAAQAVDKAATKVGDAAEKAVDELKK